MAFPGESLVCPLLQRQMEGFASIEKPFLNNQGGDGVDPY
jgi:hypothetical protein